ncbi:Rqc2 family fibronectin-binding protein [Oscillospiraceae bacterium LTW-04]|nr:NFACT RNA binding domain-containing protein [Oscillospiraceae bacterium MB24-C1]
MALDGMMLSLLKAELSQVLIGSRVDKVYQPVKEELILAIRARQENRRLLLCAHAASARAHFTTISVENPKQPPMFCMLLRKWVGNAKLVAIRQPGFERVLFFDFETVNDLGDTVIVTLAAELMGRYSNVILIGADGRIIDSMKRVGADRSSLRQILPGLRYENPPPQERIDLLADGAQAVIDALKASPRDIDTAKLLQETLSGASPVLAREIVHRALGGISTNKSELSQTQYAALVVELEKLCSVLESGVAEPTTVLTSDGVPKDFSFIPIGQYGNAMQVKRFDEISVMLDAFYGEKDAVDRMKQKMSDFSRLITARIERIERKLSAQKQELLDCKNREQLRRFGDLLSANMYQLEKGMNRITVPDYFDEAGGDVTIPLDIRLTPVQNVQRYYKEYRRADTAEKMLKDLIAQGEQELAYLDTVYDLMTRARSEAELSAIRAELSEGGYLKAAPSGKKKQEQKLLPLQYRSSDGFLILSGRNNLQNERLTLKDSRKTDIWFHTQKIAGSHTVIVTEGQEVPNRTLTEAAVIAAVNSKARNSAKVPVDYTTIKNVKKQPGGKPGMVIYENFSTAIVDPDEALVQSLMLP